MKITFLFCFILPVLVSCGGGGSSSTPTSTGVFIDSPVINIGYRTETQNGVTNSRGEFKYYPGETVTFFIGDLEFPSVLADERVTPLDMADTDDISHPMVVNIARLLQTLDKDGDPTNGITIADAARAVAVQLDFDLPLATFERSNAVITMISNGGQDDPSSELINTVAALINLVAGVASSGGSFSDPQPITVDSLIGTWQIASPTQLDFFVLSFFADGTYVHAEVDETTDNAISGMEWGDFTYAGLGDTTATQLFDNNGDAGLSDFSGGNGPSLKILPQASGSLLFGPDDNNDGISDGAFGLTQIDSGGLLGTWTSTTTDAELLMLTFFDDTYFHGEVDRNDPALMSGMEIGTYSHDGSTGLMAVSQTFDNNGNAGFTDFVGAGAPNLFVHVSGDTLTLTMDNDGDSLIDETIEFTRQ
ncbi:hypothetical protein U062_01879 [Gammaproteobacteria bacterium MOLA455]|nr:hypothetical protein U062_01879 [Gammaproteobacteria bacterium MOLA455]